MPRIQCYGIQLFNLFFTIMEQGKSYYATAFYFVPMQSGSAPEPAKHRYFLFTDFDDESLKLINEENLCGNWMLKCGRRERFSFERYGVSNGRELSEISVYSGQTYKRTPDRKTFVISKSEFLEHQRYR